MRRRQRLGLMRRSGRPGSLPVPVPKLPGTVLTARVAGVLRPLRLPGLPGVRGEPLMGGAARAFAGGPGAALSGSLLPFLVGVRFLVRSLFLGAPGIRPCFPGVPLEIIGRGCLPVPVVILMIVRRWGRKGVLLMVGRKSHVRVGAGRRCVVVVRFRKRTREFPFLVRGAGRSGGAARL